jgi:hypothetical protein
MRKIVLTLLSIVSLAALVACGGSSSSTISVPPSPSGGNNAGFSNASLTGNYVLAVNGVTANNAFAVVGVFKADGNGNVTSGTRDTVNDGGGQTLAEPVTGTYSVNQDGRGQLILNGSSGQGIYRFVLQSPSSGKLFQDGTTSNNVAVDAVGRIQAQPTTVPTTLAGTYVIRLDGEDSGRLSYGAVGGLTFSGTSISGAIDENDAGSFDLNGSLAISSGNYSLTSTGRGIFSYVTPSSSATTASPQGTHNFIVYYVSPSRLELISADQKFFLHGYADQQAAVVDGTIAAFTGDQVFNISGIDSTGNAAQETGRFTLNGSGALANGFADYNDGGSLLTDTSFTGSYTVAASGRWQANLNYAAIGTSLGLVGWQVSPSQSTLLTTNSTLLETGTMRAQTLGLTTASVTGNYAENLSGGNSSLGNVESTGNFLADGVGDLTGTIDSQSDNSGLSTDAATTGSYSIDPTYGRSTGFIGSVPVSFYTVDAGTIYFFSTDSSSLYQGMLVAQQP